jgi:prepilin-type N-terminal cleavage/methylation domain-containing protein
MIRRARRGFTFIEMLVVMIVLGVLAGLAVMRYIDLKHRALVAQVVSDLEAVRTAAYGSWSETTRWPQESSPGQVPPELVAFLGPAFSFTRPDYTLDWENFVPANGGPSATMQLGIVLTSNKPRLITSLGQVLHNKGPFIVVNGTLTYIIVGPDGRS